MVRTKKQIKEFSILRLRVNLIKRHKTKNKNKNMLPLLSAALRGVLKGLPAVNAIIEAVKNRKAAKVIESAKDIVLTQSGVSSEIIEQANKELPHNWLSIFFQLVTVGIVIYSFFTKQLTAETVVNLMKELSAGF